MQPALEAVLGTSHLETGSLEAAATIAAEADSFADTPAGTLVDNLERLEIDNLAAVVRIAVPVAAKTAAPQDILLRTELKLPTERTVVAEACLVPEQSSQS